jgi:hypothetical protein
VSAFSAFPRASKQANVIFYLAEKRPELSQTTHRKAIPSDRVAFFMPKFPLYLDHPQNEYV